MYDCYHYVVSNPFRGSKEITKITTYISKKSGKIGKITFPILRTHHYIVTIRYE